MAKRITISVPDKLHEKIEEWRSSINFSKEFQKHITGLIEKKEHYQKKLKGEDMAQIIERLKEQQDESQGDLRFFGKNEGLSWAKSAHYNDLQYVLKWDGGIMPDQYDNEELHLYFHSLITKGDYYSDHRHQAALLIQYNEDQFHDHWLNEHGEIFLDGWLEGVNDFWDEVSDKL